MSVVLALLGELDQVGLGPCLERAGAYVRVTSSLADAWRGLASLGPVGSVVVDPEAAATAGSSQADLHVLCQRGPVVVLSANATTEQRIDLLNTGADCVLASSYADEVVAALTATLRRSATASTGTTPQVVRSGDVCVDSLHRTASRAGRVLALTPLEFDLLAHFVAHEGQALSRDQLLASVWGYDIGGRETVTVHVRRLRCKVEDDPSQPTLIQTVWGIGYRLSPDPATTAVALGPPDASTSWRSSGELLGAS